MGFDFVFFTLQYNCLLFRLLLLFSFLFLLAVLFSFYNVVQVNAWKSKLNYLSKFSIIDVDGVVRALGGQGVVGFAASMLERFVLHTFSFGRERDFFFNVEKFWYNEQWKGNDAPPNLSNIAHQFYLSQYSSVSENTK